jgi:SpoVK/Ycf46/Vps4 family AAA+-type ATPase
MYSEKLKKFKKNEMSEISNNNDNKDILKELSKIQIVKKNVYSVVKSLILTLIVIVIVNLFVELFRNDKINSNLMGFNQEFPLIVNDLDNKENNIEETKNWIENCVIDGKVAKDLESIFTLEELVNWFSKGVEKSVKSHVRLLNKNIILHGPPGSGKTYIANQICEHEACCYIKISGNLDEVFVGSGSSKWRKITKDAKVWMDKYFFKTLKKSSKIKPFVILINEIDGIAKKKDERFSSNDNSLVNEILNYIDEKDENIILIGTANDFGIMEKAFFRSGRFHSIYVGYPDNIDEINKLFSKASRVFLDEIGSKWKLESSFFDEKEEKPIENFKEQILISNEFIENFSKLLNEKYLKEGLKDKLILPYIKENIFEKTFYNKLKRLKQSGEKLNSNSKIIFNCNDEISIATFNENLKSISEEKRESNKFGTGNLGNFMNHFMDS